VAASGGGKRGGDKRFGSKLVGGKFGDGKRRWRACRGKLDRGGRSGEKLGGGRHGGGKRGGGKRGGGKHKRGSGESGGGFTQGRAASSAAASAAAASAAAARLSDAAASAVTWSSSSWLRHVRSKKTVKVWKTAWFFLGPNDPVLCPAGTQVAHGQPECCAPGLRRGGALRRPIVQAGRGPGPWRLPSRMVFLCSAWESVVSCRHGHWHWYVTLWALSRSASESHRQASLSRRYRWSHPASRYKNWIIPRPYRIWSKNQFELP
jgi:hypothetical protein